MADDRLVQVLGGVSAGLGIPMLLKPAGFGNAIGVGDTRQHRLIVGGVGMQELLAATGLLGWRDPFWLWGRVGGDIMHLGMLGVAVKNRVTNRDVRAARRTAIAAASVVGITGVDLYAALTRSRTKTAADMTATTTVTCSPQDAYELWRRLERLPSFMVHLDEVRMTGNGSSHWRASAPFGQSVEWDAEITDDVPGQRLAWRSVEGSAITNEGEVRFVPAPGGRGTEIHVRLRYLMPGGRLGEAVAKYFGEDPHQQLDDDLRRFKQVAETGEVIRSEGAPGGKRARREFPQHPARPLSAKELEEIR